MLSPLVILHLKIYNKVTFRSIPIVFPFFIHRNYKMSYIEATREINSLVNKIKYREERIAQQYREIHDMASELDEYMGNAAELIYKNRLILKRNADFKIIPIKIDVLSEAVTYCYHEIIDKQLHLISQNSQRIKELDHEIEELVKVNEALRRNKKDLEAQIQKNYLQEDSIGKTRICLIASITFAVLLVIALLLTATLRESAVVLLFLGLAIVSFVWNSILVFERQFLNHRKDELTEKEFLFNKAIQSFENEKQLFEQEKLRLKGINETTIKTVNEKLQIARQQKEKYLTQEKQYQEVIAQLNEKIANLKEEIKNQAPILNLQNKVETLEKEIQEKQIAIDLFKEQIEAGEHIKRKADNLELDYKRLFEKYHNRESEIQTLKSDLNNSTDENKRLSNKIASLGAEIENIQKQREECQKEKQELERKYKDLMSQEKSLENDNKVFQRQQEYYQKKYSELDIEFKRVEAENQELERKNQNLISQETSLISKNKELQTQNNSFQTKISDLEKEIKRIREETQGKENDNADLSSQFSSLKAKNEELQAQNNSFQTKISDLEKEIKFLKKENQKWENKYQVSNSQINSLTTKNEELEKQILNYRYEVIQLNIANQDLMKECESLKNEKLKYSNSNKDYLDLQTRFSALQKVNQELKNEKCNIEYQIPLLEKENKELHKQNKKYLTKNTELQIELQELKVDYKKLKEDFLNNKSVQQDYLDLQTQFKALQKENEELRYYNSKLESKKSQEIIRRNCSDDELDNSSQSVPAEIEPVTPTIDNSANSEQDLYYEIADEIIKKASYSKEELIALYRRFNMSIFSGNAKINTWTDDVFGDHLIFEENKRFVIDPDIAAKVRNSEVENE